MELWKFILLQNSFMASTPNILDPTDNIPFIFVVASILLVNHPLG